jgi:hypothetical protein
LIFALAAWQAGEIHRDFLQANDIKITQSMNGIRYAPGIHSSIQTPCPLDVPTQQLHTISLFIVYSCNKPRIIALL